jgi:hypothetical protein
MKIKNVFLALLAMVLIAGCKDDDKNTEQFSELTTEQHKANIEESGMAVVDQLNGMSDLDGIKVAIDFVALMTGTNNTENNVMAVLKPVTALKQGAGAAFNLKATTVDKQSLSQLFDDETGIYEYEAQSDSFKLSGGSTDTIEYKFPTASSSSNNATVSITNFDYFSTSNPDVSEISDELPKSFDVTLAVDNMDLMVFEFTASYDNDGIPTDVSETITIEKFIVSSSLSRSTSKVAFDQSFTYDGDNILSSHFDSDGNFDYDNVSNNVDGAVEFDNQTIVDASNAWISIDNLKIEGVVNWKTLRESGDNVEEADSAKVVMENLAEIMNKNVSLFVKYHDNNQIIAASEFYAFLETDDYSDYESWEFDMRMKFNDGSYMDDSFFTEENFTELIQDAETLLSDMETNYETTN